MAPMNLQAHLGARGLAVRNEPEKGRCLVADRPFFPGQTILEQDPYVAVLDDNSRGKRCDGCFKESTNLKRCSACKFVWYCSHTCQTSEWKLHQEECKVIVRLRKENSRLPTPSLQMMLRLLLRRRLQANGVIPSTSMDRYDIVQALPTHMSETDEERLVLYAQMANLVKNIVSNEDEEIKEITENFCRFACNAHTVCDDELRPLGNGLFPVISIINHSCSPNSVLLFEGRRAVVRAVENINRGSEVTISYVELAANTSSRYKALSKQYFFTCKCSRCTHGGSEAGLKADGLLEGFRCPDPVCEGFVLLDNQPMKQWRCIICSRLRDANEIEDLSSEADKTLMEADHLQSSGILEARRAFEQAENLQVTLFHPQSVQLMRIRDSLLKINLSLLDWESALKYCRLTFPAYEIAYPHNHPLLGLQQYTLGKLEWHLGDPVEAAKSLTKALDILSITHGSKGEFVQQLSIMLREAQAEAEQKTMLDVDSLPFESYT